jgi:hypothetical protein
MNKTVNLLIGLLLFILTSSVQAYEVSTHILLTENALARSVLFLDSSLLSDLGQSILETALCTATDGGLQLSLLDKEGLACRHGSH